MDSQTGTANENDHFRRLRTAQAVSILGNISLTLAANIFLAATTAWLIWHSGGTWTVFIWLGLVAALSIIRFAVFFYVSAVGSHSARPVQVLHVLTVTSFMSGLSWTPVPLYFAVPGDGSVLGYIVFVMAGVTTGAIIQSLAYWRVAVAFGAPLMLSTVAMMVAQALRSRISSLPM